MEWNKNEDIFKLIKVEMPFEEEIWVSSASKLSKLNDF